MEIEAGRMSQRTAEADASEPTSAACYNRAEDIFVFAVIVAKGELLNIKRKVLLRDMVERAHNATLQGSLIFPVEDSICSAISISLAQTCESLPDPEKDAGRDEPS